MHPRLWQLVVFEHWSNHQHTAFEVDSTYILTVFEAYGNWSYYIPTTFDFHSGWDTVGYVQESFLVYSKQICIIRMTFIYKFSTFWNCRPNMDRILKNLYSGWFWCIPVKSVQVWRGLYNVYWNACISIQEFFYLVDFMSLPKQLG